jgi:predicted ester cyclase
MLAAEQREMRTMTTEEQKAIVRRYLDEVWNRGNFAVIDELMAPDYRRYTAAGFLDRAGQRQRIAAFRTGLPDVHVAEERLIAEGDQIAFRIQISGTHDGPLLGVAPTHRPVTITATDIVRFDEAGKIAEHWGNLDELGLLRQIGALPQT